jgi:bifunctional polynucleotide phosphatase/kinase
MNISTINDSLYYRFIPSEKPVFAIDLDHTIIRPKSGNTFPTGPADWKFVHENIPRKLIEQSKTHQIVIFSNQNRTKKHIADIFAKIDAVWKSICCNTALPLPSIFIATEKDQYRKPLPGMYDEYRRMRSLTCSSERANACVSEIEIAPIIYVGDAAGRDGDHSTDDRGFAANCGFEFKTPEEYFEFDGVPNIISQPMLLVEDIIKKSRDISTSFNEPSKLEPVDHQEMIILIGAPASGKSTFAAALASKSLSAHRYIITSKDAHNDISARDAIRAGFSVIIDNTNPDDAAREPYVKIADEYNVPIRYVYFKRSNDELRYLNLARSYYQHVPQIPAVAYNIFNSRLRLPKQLNIVCGEHDMKGLITIYIELQIDKILRVV